ncbi:MAG: DsrE family protein [Bacteroidetes bacterium]|nr:DsrE family protein [Bacteroidota bacterium]
MKNSIKKITVVILMIVSWNITSAQQSPVTSSKPEHKIIFQLTTGDTTSHKQLMKQFSNILSVSPTTQIEVVCHGPGLDMLVAGKTIVGDKIKLMAEKGVAFKACEFSMKERKVEKEKIIESAGFVAAGIVEIVSKQEQGWSYIKAGN